MVNGSRSGNTRLTNWRTKLTFALRCLGPIFCTSAFMLGKTKHLSTGIFFLRWLELNVSLVTYSSVSTKLSCRFACPSWKVSITRLNMMENCSYQTNMSATLLKCVTLQYRAIYPKSVGIGDSASMLLAISCASLSCDRLLKFCERGYLFMFACLKCGLETHQICTPKNKRFSKTNLCNTP